MKMATEEKLASLGPALVVADTDGIIHQWSAGAEQTFGHDAASAIGQSLDLIVPPDYRAHHWSAFRAAMSKSEGRTDRASANVPVLCRSGQIKRLAVRLLVLHSARDQAVGAMAIFTPDDESAAALYRL